MSRGMQYGVCVGAEYVNDGDPSLLGFQISQRSLEPLFGASV
jgi:hypothetical protein